MLLSRVQSIRRPKRDRGRPSRRGDLSADSNTDVKTHLPTPLTWRGRSANQVSTRCLEPPCYAGR